MHVAKILATSHNPKCDLNMSGDLISATLY